MKLGFVFDACFTEYNNKFYSINLTQDLWKNIYLNFFDEIVVIGRSKKTNINPEGKLVRSDNDKVSFKCLSNANQIKRIFSQKKEEKFIEAAIKDCDKVICRSWWGVNVCKKLNKPYIIEVVNCVWDSYWNHSLLGKIVALPNFLLQRKAIKNAPYVIYVTKEFLQHRYPSRGITIGVSDVSLKNVEQSDDVLLKRIQRINENKLKIKIGTAAGISVKYKGQRFVIKALAILKQHGMCNYEYQVAGSGDPSKLLKLAKKYGVQDQLKILGPIPHHMIFDWYDSIDLYIQPSLTEGLPRAVVEAMSRALPCISTNAGGLPELLETNYICKRKGNIAKQIAKKIKSLSKERMIEMAKRNYECSKNYRADILIQKKYDFLKNFNQ